MRLKPNEAERAAKRLGWKPRRGEVVRLWQRPRFNQVERALLKLKGKPRGVWRRAVFAQEVKGGRGFPWAMVRVVVGNGTSRTVLPDDVFPWLSEDGGLAEQGQGEVEDDQDGGADLEDLPSGPVGDPTEDPDEEAPEERDDDARDEHVG